MILKQIASKSFLFASSNENELFNNIHSLQIDNKTINFKFSDLVALEKALDSLSSLDKDIILSSVIGLRKGIITYKNEDGLKVYIKDLPEYLIVISVGEFQPSLYKIYIESLFRKIS